MKNWTIKNTRKKLRKILKILDGNGLSWKQKKNAEYNTKSLGNLF